MEDTKVQGYNMLTAILLGKRGCDKALIGNTMLGNPCFSRQTSTCKLVVYQEEGQICDIINTPDLYHGPKPDSKEETLAQTKLSYSGKRVFLLILQQDNISSEEMTMFAKLKETYGETIVDNVIVVLDTNNKASQSEVDKNIQRILDECGGRVCYFKQGMKKDELNKQLLSTFKKMLQKNAPDRLGTTSGKPCDKTSENEKSQPEAAGEQACVAVPEVKVKMVDDRLGNTTDESKFKQDAYLPGGKKVEDMKHEAMGRSFHNTLEKKPEEKKVQSQPTGNSHFKGEKHAAAVHEEQNSSPVPKEKKMTPSVQESLDRSNKLNQKFQDKKAQLNLPGAAVPGGRKGEDMKFEAKGSFNRNTLTKKPEEKKVQTKTTDEKAGASAPEVKKTDDRIYETVNDSKHSSYETMNKCSYNTLAKGPEERRPPAVPTGRPPTPTQPQTGRDVLTIVLLGQTGSGKSATGNTILARRKFDSHASSAPVTQRCEVAEGIVCGIKIRVIDTPDFFDEDLDNPKVHIQKCKDLCQFQSVVYLLVMHMGRFTEGEREAASNMQTIFGEQVVKQTVVLFTGKEKLREMSLYDYIKNADPQLLQLVQTFDQRIYAFNNNDKRHYQVKDLVKILMKMQIEDSIKDQYNRYKAELKECTVL